MAWLPGYAYRKPLVLTGGASGAQTDFQLNIDIAHVAAKMQADFDDIRFTQNNGTTLIDAWLESKVDSASAKTWIKAPFTPANGVSDPPLYVYYGKAVANYWDIGATFLFGDDFPGSSIDTGKWDGDTGDASVSGGILTVDRNASWGGVDSFNSYTPDMALRCRSKTNGDDAGGGPAIGFEKTPCCEGRSNIYNTGLTTNDDAGNGEATTALWSHSTWYVHDLIQLSGTSVELLVDGVSKVTHTTRVGTIAQNVRIASYQSSIEVDWVLVRKYAANPPTYQFGAEESAPTTGNPFWYYQMLRRRNQ